MTRNQDPDTVFPQLKITSNQQKTKALLPQLQTSFFYKINEICLLILISHDGGRISRFQAPVIQGRVRGLAGVPLLPQPQLEAAARPPGGHQGPRLAIEVMMVTIVVVSCDVNDDDDAILGAWQQWTSSCMMRAARG